MFSMMMLSAGRSFDQPLTKMRAIVSFSTESHFRYLSGLLLGIYVGVNNGLARRGRRENQKQASLALLDHLLTLFDALHRDDLELLRLQKFRHRTHVVHHVNFRVLLLANLAEDKAEERHEAVVGVGPMGTVPVAREHHPTAQAIGVKPWGRHLRQVGGVRGLPARVVMHQAPGPPGTRRFENEELGLPEP